MIDVNKPLRIFDGEAYTPARFVGKLKSSVFPLIVTWGDEWDVLAFNSAGFTKDGRGGLSNIPEPQKRFLYVTMWGEDSCLATVKPHVATDHPEDYHCFNKLIEVEYKEGEITLVAPVISKSRAAH